VPADTFDDFVKQRTAQANETVEEVDWEKTRATWLRELGCLYDCMEAYLKSYTNSGLIRIERHPVQLTEDYLGTYDAEKLTLFIGNDKVVAEPIGTLLIGSRGRVDLSGTRKTLRIVLLDKGGPAMKITISAGDAPIETSSRALVRGDVDHAGWYIATRPPSATVTAFSEDSFRDAIMEVSGA